MCILVLNHRLCFPVTRPHPITRQTLAAMATRRLVKSDTPARTEQRCKRDSGVDDDVIDWFAACVLSHCQAVTTWLNSAEALLMVLVTFVLVLKSQMKTSAVTNTCCRVT